MSEESEKFFGAWRERAKKTCPRYGTRDEDEAFLDGIAASEHAFQEMVVGEPIKAAVRHKLNPQSDPYTHIVERNHKDGGIDIYLGRHHGTDGEEVYVFVVRKGYTT